MKIKYMGEVNSERYIWKNKKINILDNGEILLSDISQEIDNYYHLKQFLRFNNSHPVYIVKPSFLISPYNFDILAKYIYAKDRLLKLNSKFAKQVYLKHIKAFNNYKEPDGSKHNKSDYLNNFNTMIDYLIKKNCMRKTFIPVSSQFLIIDGSHRTALSLLAKQDINCLCFDTVDLKFDFCFFKHRKLKSVYLDYMAFHYKEILPHIGCSIHKYDTISELNKIVDDVYQNNDVFYFKKRSINTENLKKIIPLPEGTGEENYIMFICQNITDNKADFTTNNSNEIELLFNLFLNDNSVKFFNKLSTNRIDKLLKKIKENDLVKNNLYSLEHSEITILKDDIKISTNPTKHLYFANIMIKK